MPPMNGFELCEKLLELDVNTRVCCMSAAELNIEALEKYIQKQEVSDVFIKKPITAEN